MLDAVAEPAVADPEAEEADSPADARSAQPIEDPTPADAAVEEPVVETAAPSATADDESDDAAELLPAGDAVDDAIIEAEPAEDAPPSDGGDDLDAAAVDEPAPADAAVDGDASADVAEAEDAPVESDAPYDDPEPTDAPRENDDSDDDGAPANAPVEDPTPADTAVEEPPVDVSTDTSADAPTETSAATTAGAAIGAAAIETPASTDADEATPALTLRNVTKTFGELRAVDGIDLTIPAGSFYGLVGPNGAGKTTTLSIIAGLLRADRGTVSINGVDAAKNARAAKKMIGVLPDRLRTFDRLTGRQLLSYYGALRGLPAALVESRSADLARAFDLVDALARPVSDYSAGMTKKVMLAGAMIHSPRLLVLDEPFEAVDPVSSAVILDILGAYVSHGGTVILSSHGMELVERVCSRVAVIVSGQVLAEGTVDEVRGEASLEQRFLELAGGLGDVEGLEWLHTFSG